MAELSGYAILYHERSLDLGGFVEQWTPAATRRTLDEAVDVRALFAHDVTKPLGRRSTGSLQLASDARGLRATIQLPTTSWAHDLLAIARDKPGWSFAFTTLRDEWEHDGHGLPVRTMRDARISEVSAGVTFPAFPQTEPRAATAMAAAGMRREETRSDVAYVVQMVRALALEHPGRSIRIAATYNETAARPRIEVLSVRPSTALPSSLLALNRNRQRQAGAAMFHLPATRRS